MQERGSSSFVGPPGGKEMVGEYGRDPPPNIICINAKEKISAEMVGKALGEEFNSNLGKLQWSVREGRNELSRFWEVLVAGSDNVAARAISRLIDAQRLGPGRWQRHKACDLQGNEIEVFLGRDKSKRQIREEILLKKARKVIETCVPKESSVFAVKHRGVVSVQWQDLLQLSAPCEDGPPGLRWKAGLLSDLGLVKSQVEKDIQEACAPKHRQEPWDG